MIPSANDLAEKIVKINFTNMTEVQLCKWLRNETELSLKDTLRIAKCFKTVYNLGTIRGSVLK